MSAMLPMAVYGLEVPAGDIPIPAKSDIPSAFRITMAAIDPSAEPEGEAGAPPRATLKIIRQSLDYDDEDDEDEEFDIEEMERMLAEEEDDDDEDSDDEDLNGGPSDPAKSKKARKEAAQKEIQRVLEEEEDDDDELPNGVNGTKMSLKALGKMPASDESEDDEDDDDSDIVAGEWEEFVICTLDPNQHYNQPLDITVGERERVLFKVSGTHSIFLTGNYVEPAIHEHGPGMYDPDSDEEEDYDMEPDSDELDEDEEDELDEMDDPRIMEIDSEEEEEAPQLIKSTKAEKKAEKKGKNKRPAEDEELADAETIDELIAKETKKDEAKLSKKQLKKLKKNDGSATAPATEAAKKDAEVPSSIKSDKKVSFAKELEQGPTPTKDGKVADKEKPKGSLGIKTVQGVKMEDKKLGSGPAAKSGDRVGMRYIGKLENGKVFDSNKSGKPFAFKLGSGEVIKGWDIGVAGMTVGGERRITIPAHHAYGSKGVPGIPGNSTLVFDVKLLEINKKK